MITFEVTPMSSSVTIERVPQRIFEALRNAFLDKSIPKGQEIYLIIKNCPEDLRVLRTIDPLDNSGTVGRLISIISHAKSCDALHIDPYESEDIPSGNTITANNDPEDISFNNTITANDDPDEYDELDDLENSDTSIDDIDDEEGPSSTQPVDEGFLCASGERVVMSKDPLPPIDPNARPEDFITVNTRNTNQKYQCSCSRLFSNKKHVLTHLWTDHRVEYKLADEFLDTIGTRRKRSKARQTV